MNFTKIIIISLIFMLTSVNTTDVKYRVHIIPHTHLDSGWF
jgi:hypothetical protein